MARASVLEATPATGTATTVASAHRQSPRRRFGEPVFWYVVLLLIAVVTVFPFALDPADLGQGAAGRAVLDAAAVHPP